MAPGRIAFWLQEVMARLGTVSQARPAPVRSTAMAGKEMDEVEARNRAYLEGKLQRRMAGAVTIEDVMAMRNAGVADDVIITHIRYHGMARELTPQDLIALQQQGLSPNVIRAMQEMPPPQVVVAQPAPPPVIVDEWGYYHYPHRWGYYAPPPRVGVGFTFH